jgi:hypothetical protein
MNLELLSHASIKIEDEKKLRLITDPWFISPVFFSSWYLCPEPNINEDIYNNTNFIYLTHWHFDHFDYKTLRKFNKQTKIFVPEFPSSIMKQELNKLGFKNVCEMVNKKEYKLSDQFSILSHQIEHHDDSILIIKVDGKTIINLNDAKPLPSSWKWIKKNFFKPDFMFRSHSIAWSFPTKYKFSKDDDNLFSKEVYFQEYMNVMKILEPKYSIPFASYICHLHKETLEDNNNLISPYELQNFLKKNYFGSSIFKIMNPGGKYSDSKNFYDIKNYDFNTEVNLLKEKYKKYLEKIYDKEENASFNIINLKIYFKRFFKSIKIIRFTVKDIIWAIDLNEKFIVIDFYNKKIIEADNIEDIKYSSLLKINKSVLNQSLKENIFSNIDIAKRWNVEVKKGNVQKHLYMTALISIFEGGILPLEKKIFNRRFVVGYFRRLPELFDYIIVFFKLRKSVKEARNYISGAKKT